TVLMTAVGEGDNVKGAELLLDRGVDVNAVNDDGDTALMNAAVYGSQLCVELLIRRGANVNARNKQGMTALKAALHPSDFFPTYVGDRREWHQGQQPQRPPFQGVADILVRAGAKE
ncbi:MAG: ankyrin repeat domain-containing protein, partial [Blastocatellia bacterium]